MTKDTPSIDVAEEIFDAFQKRSCEDTLELIRCILNGTVLGLRAGLRASPERDRILRDTMCDMLNDALDITKLAEPDLFKVVKDPDPPQPPEKL
jgi:hypothetical protein